MNTFKKKSMYLAVVSGLAAIGAAGTAEAVHINPDGLGQVLIYPYYTVRAGQFTLINIINSQANTKAVKIRFLEGKNSREVLDFNIFMSPNDVWTGAIVPTADGAKIVSNDNTCVTPSDLFLENRKDSNNVQNLNEFKNYQYTGAFTDANNSYPSLDRTREGYFEVIEMGVIDDDAVDGNAIAAASTAATVTGYIKHVGTATSNSPANCAALDLLDSYVGNANPIQFPNTGLTIVPVGNLTQAPRGGITGRASIYNPDTGTNFTFNPTAFDAWTVNQSYFSSGDLRPSLGDAFPATSNVFTAAGVVTTAWGAGPAAQTNAMSATMMRNTVINEFIKETTSNSRTDWVVTFPTKRIGYVAVGAGLAVAPFASNFSNANGNGSCDPYGFSLFNREEGPFGQQTLTFPPVSPLPPATGPAAGATLCWEANVVPFTNNASLLGSTNINNLIPGLQALVDGARTIPGLLTTPSLRPAAGQTIGTNGYMIMNFNAPGSLVVPLANAQALVAPAAGTTRTPLGGALGAPFAATYNGLPVIGFAVHNYVKLTGTGIGSFFGGLIDHKFTRSITP